MNLNFLCCIGAEQKHDQSGLLKMNQVYFYRAYADETMSEILKDNFFNHSESHLKENDIILAYSPNEKDLPKVRWLRIVTPHAGLVKTEQVDNSYLLEVLRNDLGDLGEQVAGIEEKIPSKASATNQLATASDINTKITNCLTEIPQDIKLELNAGTLTLKAGSKVYVPNGAGIFNPVVIADDLVCPAISGNRIVAIYRTNTGVLNYQSLDTMSAGASDSLADVQWHVWYDTVNNVVNRYLEDTNIAVAGQSLPIGIISVVDGVITEIKQVFNGFGYIGGIVFTLPGVKGLIPNGRNEDGTLKNVLLNCTSVQISSDFSTFDSLHSLFLGSNGRCAWYAPDGFIYDVDDNKIYHSTNGTPLISMDAGTFDVVKGKIINFNPKIAFHAVDYSEYLQTKKSLDNKVSELNSSILSTKTELSNSISSTKTELNSSISSVDSSAVHKTGNETIAGIKTFEASPIMPTPAANSNSTNAATTAWVRTHTSNVVRLVAEQKATSANNYTWYRKYSDGWVEQGGRQNIGGNSTVTFPIAMADKDSYDLQLTVIDKYRFACVSSIDRRTATSIGVSTGDDSSANDDGTINWNVCGYAAS